MHLDFHTGIFDGQPPQASRTIGEMASIFRYKSAVAEMDPSTLVYQIFGCPGEVEGAARMLYATTVLHPGSVGGEYFMTRGHFHVNPERGELMLTLRGIGALLLMDRSGNTTMEPMSAGSMHDIDGRLAHRVANTGEEPLVFFVAWMSDCGHDYASISRDGFSKVLVRGDDKPVLIARSQAVP